MKKFLLGLLIIAVLSAGYLTWQRYQVVAGNQTVELVLDYGQLKQEKQAVLLPKLARAGLTSLARGQKSLHQLAKAGMIEYIPGQLPGLLAKLGLPLTPADPNSLYLIGSSKILQQIQVQVGGKLLPSGLLRISDYQPELLRKPLVFSPAGKQQAEKLQLNLVPRISGDCSPAEFKQALAYFPEVRSVIFSGSRVVGWPEQLAQTACVFRRQNLTLGLIEQFLARQRGVETLAKRLDLHTVRVHSIQPEELNQLGVDRTVARYLRAVTERGVRLLYLKPFSEPKLTKQLVTQIAVKLKEKGYKLGAARPYRNYQPPSYLSGLTLLGVGALLGLAAELIWGWGLAGLLVSGWGLGSLALINETLAFQAGALLTAIFAPWILFLFLVKFIDRNLSSLKLFIWLTGLSLAGGILVRGLLSSTEYLLQIKRFRGVKLAFTAPLLLSSGYLLFRRYLPQTNLIEWGHQILNQPIKVKEMAGGSLLLVVGIIYLTRTGNLSLLAVSELELAVRRWLETVLPVRPRFKSFLVGHPLLLVGIAISLARRRVSWWVVVGLIGQINLINTFAHLHTPISVVFWRVTEGIGLGLVLGGIILTFGRAGKIFS